jgi:hypothetical protein
MSFLNYFSVMCKTIEIINKYDSSLMKLINFFLKIGNLLGLCSITDFMMGYVTTIGNKIYSYPKWNWGEFASPCTVHELTHVILWSKAYALKYIFSKKWRLYYESICIQTEMLCFPNLKTDTKEFERRADMLSYYGIPKINAIKELSKRIEEVQKGSPHPSAIMVYNVYKEWTGRFQTHHEIGKNNAKNSNLFK